MCLPELAAERGDLSCHALTAVGELLQIPLQLPSLGIGARVLLLHLLQLPLQLLQAYHRLIQLVNEGKRARRWKRTEVRVREIGFEERGGTRRAGKRYIKREIGPGVRLTLADYNQ